MRRWNLAKSDLFRAIARIRRSNVSLLFQTEDRELLWDAVTDCRNDANKCSNLNWSEAKQVIQNNNVLTVETVDNRKLTLTLVLACVS